MGVARENLLCFEHEHGHVHAQEPGTIFAWGRTVPVKKNKQTNSACTIQVTLLWELVTCEGDYL